MNREEYEDGKEVAERIEEKQAKLKKAREVDGLFLGKFFFFDFFFFSRVFPSL